jgi:hypothetical protein
MCTGRLESFSQTLNSLHRRLTGQLLETAFDFSGQLKPYKVLGVSIFAFVLSCEAKAF